MDPEHLETAAAASSAASESAPDASGSPPHAESSPAKDEDKRTLLEAVVNAVDAKNIEDEDAPIDAAPEPAAESSPAEGEQSPDPEAKPDLKIDVSDDALLATLEQLKADVPLNKIERFREVLTENRQLKVSNERYKGLDTTLTEIGNDARRMGLTNEELAQLFAWPRLLAKDPTAASEQLAQFSARWSERVGKVLPTDLKQRVDDGLLDEATAKEVAQLRANRSLGETRTAAEAELRERAASDQTQREIVDSVNNYQAELKRSDPDYTPEKHAMVVDTLTALVTANGVPANPQDARALAKRAYDTVTTRLAKFRPAPRSVQAPTVGRRLNKPADAQPKSMFEAISNAVGE